MTQKISEKHLINLAQPRLGARVVFATDDFFAPKERLILPTEPVFIADKFDDNGKWMDGWESRRKRTAGHDHCILRFGQRGVIDHIDLDTSHFTGNYPPQASIDACVSDQEHPDDVTHWENIVAMTPLTGDSHHFLPVDSARAWTHLRLNIFPDGGIARMRVFGEIVTDWAAQDPDAVIDLAALEYGGIPIIANDEHFGKLENILAPGRGRNMGDGWETRRRREAGHDWGIIRLAHPGVIAEILVDTAFFKGNYPDRCSLQAAKLDGAEGPDLVAQSKTWEILLPEQKLEMDREHIFRDAVRNLGPVSHVKLNIIPDGGVSRLRLFGKITPQGA